MAQYPVGVVPSDLNVAIQNASQTYNVPPEILVGVWHVESGSTFPNPAVNSSGYGGLFGTTKWNASTQEQANYSASILQNLYNRYGDWSAALYHYSGGTPTYAGKVMGTGQVSSVVSNPQQQQQQSSGDFFGIGSAINNFTSSVENIWLTGTFALLGVAIIIVGLIAIVRPVQRAKELAPVAGTAAVAGAAV